MLRGSSVFAKGTIVAMNYESTHLFLNVSCQRRQMCSDGVYRFQVPLL